MTKPARASTRAAVKSHVFFFPKRQEQKDDGKEEYGKFGKQHHRASPLMG